MEEKYRKFEGSKTYGNNFCKALWTKKSFSTIPMDWPIVMEFWRKQNMSSNLIVFFPVLFLHCFQRHQNPKGFEVLWHFIPTFCLSLSFCESFVPKGPWVFFKEILKFRIRRLSAIHWHMTPHGGTAHWYRTYTYSSYIDALNHRIHPAKDPIHHNEWMEKLQRRVRPCLVTWD
jgi:hypothetical protein